MSYLLTAGVLQQAANAKKQYALSFDGIDNYVQLSTHTGIITELQIGINLYYHYMNEVTTSFLGSSTGADHEHGWIYSLFDLQMTFNPKLAIGTLINYRTPEFTTLNEIVNIKFISGDIYINEVLFDGEVPRNHLNTIDYIGRRQDGRWLNGIISYLKITNTNDVVFDYDFTTGSGNILYDKGENANHGTIYGATWVEL